MSREPLSPEQAIALAYKPRPHRVERSRIPKKRRAKGRIWASLSVICLLTGCAIDGTQDLNPYTAPAVASWTPSAAMTMAASEVPKTKNFSWIEQVAIERGLSGGPNGPDRVTPSFAGDEALIPVAITSSVTRNPSSAPQSAVYSCSELTESQAYRFLAQGHRYLDRDQDGHPCEWGPNVRSNFGHVQRADGGYSRGGVMCNDGTRSPTCSVCGSGCCSGHGGCR